jgi:hypothetical protein
MINDEVSHTQAKSILHDIDLSIRHEQSIRSRSSLIWEALTPHMRKVHDRYLAILKKKQKQIETELEETTCAGCGEYYDEHDVYNTTHDNKNCRREAYKNGKDSSDSRI